MNRQSIENLCVLVRGSSPRPSGDPRYYGGNIPRLMVKDVTRDGMYVTPKIAFLTENGAALSRPMKKGDLIIAVSGDPGEPSILNVDACIHDGFVGLRELDSERVFTPYLYRYFKFNKEQNKSQAVGAIYKNLNTDQIKALKIPLPPLDQQKKIAAILAEADNYRQKTKALIAKYDELTQSLFLDMFGDPVRNPKGWNMKQIKEVCTLQGGFSFKSKDFVSEGIKLVKIANVHFEDLVWDDVDLLPESYLDKYSNFSLKEGDILMALTRPIIKSLGTVKAVTVNSSDLPCLLNQRVARFILKEEELNKRFFLGFIYTSHFRNQIDKFSSTSLQPNVSNKQIEGLEIMTPPINVQNQFAERIQAIEIQKAQAQESLEKAEDLFNSLLQKAFKGELV